MAEHFPEVVTEAPWESKRPCHQARCECGWKGRRRLDWHRACDDADDHIAKSGASNPKAAEAE